MKKENIRNFVANYIEAWSTKDSELRKRLIVKVYSKNARFYADELGDEALEHHGLEAIYINITQVNE